jgi:PRC-barrel domain
MSYEDRDTYGMLKAAQAVDPDPRSWVPTPSLETMSTIIKNEDLGDIKEIMLDMRNGRVCYAVLSFGGFLGMGEKLFAVPWNALTLDTKNKRFVLNVEKNRLKQAPAFVKDKWPNMADQAWAKEKPRCEFPAHEGVAQCER